MSEFPEGWILVPLEELVKVEWGNTNITKKAYVPVGYPAFSASGSDGFLPRFEWQGPAVILSAIGARCGKCFYAEGEWTAIKNAIVIQGNEQFLNHKLLYHYLNDQSRWTISGTGQPFITMGSAQKTRYPLAPLNEQHRILAKLEKVLSRVNDAHERLATIPLILKRFRRSVLAAACSGRLTTDWRLKNAPQPASDLLKGIQQYRLERTLSKKEKAQIETAFSGLSQDAPLLPQTWALSTIGAVGTVSNGSTPSRKVSAYWGGNIPWVSSGEVRNNVIRSTRESITDQGLSNSSTKLLPRGTVLLAMIGEGKTRGQSAILDVESTINQNVAAINISHGHLAPQYLWRWLQYQYEMTREVGSGSGPQALNCQRVRELPFHLPPLEEQQEIVRRVEALFNTIDALEARSLKAKAHVDKLTQSILAKAFRGELVPQDPNDEPASILLERVRQQRDGGSGPKVRSTTKRSRR